MKNEPVLTATGLSGFVMALLTMLVSMNVFRLSQEQMTAVQNVVVPLAIFIVPFAVSFWARSKVTPVDNPRDAEGYPLERK